MKTQMTQIGIGIAALSALAVEGKDFNRAELNAMLDRDVLQCGGAAARTL